MNLNKSYFLIMLIVLILAISAVSANEDATNETVISADSLEVSQEVTHLEEDSLENEVLQVDESQDSLETNDDVIVVNNWEELQYYCAQTDKDYTLKLKENTNFYPSDNYDDNQQINIKNNVKIIGGVGSWIGDSSPEPMQLRFLAMQVKDDSKVGLTLINVTFKWIKAGGGNRLPDGMFLKIGGKKNTIIKNCQFYNIITQYGHSCIVHLNKGTATFENCSIINCTNGYGCLSVFNRNGASVAMIVKNCYFENNYGSTEPGCINNCGKLTVYNSTFVKNRSFWWAGAIHTHGGGNTTIYDSRFIDNVAGWNGGALYTYSYLQVYNSVFIGNNCTTDNGGGAIGACEYESKPHIYIEGCLFENNSNNCWYPDSLSDGTGRGGAISIMDVGSLEVRDTTFVANAAAQGTAICAINAGSYGSPDVYIINNSFINHTRVGDVLKITTKDKIVEIHDNYYLGNSIVFSNLTLSKLSESKEQATFQITATLSHPTWYDEDILDKTLYDVYINDKYVKTVNSTMFAIDFGDLDICDVYVIPTISNRKSNSVTATSTREYIFVSKSNGNDSNNGFSRDTPVNTIKKALQLAGNCQNIILLDGDYSEDNIQISYDVTIKGEGNATLTTTTSFISNANFTLKNLKINNLNTDTFIKQNSNNLVISNCIFTNNNATLIDNNGFVSLTNSILLNNSQIIKGDINNCVLDYNWWGNDIHNPSNYVTLNITSNIDALENSQKANVKAVFYLNDGTKYTALPDINLDIIAINGIVNKKNTNIDSNVVYTLTAFEDGALTVCYNNVNVSKTFKFIKSNPNIGLTTKDIMFSDNLTITVTTPSDAEGNLTVNVSQYSQTKVINSSVTVFTFENLKADTYTITLTYTGDKKYSSKELTSTVNVNKYESATLLNISAVNVNEDVVLIITTTDSSTGNVTLIINNDTQILTLNNSKANYTIKNIKRGDYLITAIYNGDDKFLTSKDSMFIEVDNLNATMAINADDITYGDLAVVQVTLNDDATGTVTVTIDGKSNSSALTNGKANITFANLDAGLNKDITVFYTGDDTYFNLTKSANFTIGKAHLTFNISSTDIMIGQAAKIIITVPKRTSGTFTIGENVINIPLSGEVEYLIPNLEIGEYDITAIYNGNNYFTVSNSTSFVVKEYPTPQWPNSETNGKTDYESDSNGYILFTVPFDESINGITIDSEGNIFITTDSGIYSYTNQGSYRWNFTSNSVNGNFSASVIGRDVVVTPKSGDTLYFINQSSGERYGSSNIYQGSSLFAPIIDANATLYIVSELQYDSNTYKLVKIPYALWENGGDPILLDIGRYAPITSLVVNDDFIVLLLDGRLRLIDAKTFETRFTKSGNYLAIRPIIGEGNIVYAVLGDSIVAYSTSGSQLWKTKVTGGIGNRLVLDSDIGLYATNAKGNLYMYDLTTGKESLISSLEITSGILIDSNSNLYFGCDNLFYKIDSKGNVLWKSDLSSKVTGNPVMDTGGVIYVSCDDNKLFAITKGELIDPGLEVSATNITEGEEATIAIRINNQTTGIVSFTLNGVDYVFDSSGVKVISNLPAGTYNVNVTFSGDLRFNKTSKLVTFTVKAKSAPVIPDPVLKGSDINVLYTSNSYYKVKLTQNNAPLAGKTVTINFNGANYNIVTDKNGIASFKITAKPGKYIVKVSYQGKTTKNTVTVKSILQAKNLKVKKSAKTAKIKVTLKKVNNKYLKGKTLKLKINKKTLKAKTNKKGVATFKLSKSILKKLKKAKKYTYTVTYLKDSIKKSLMVK